MNQNRRQQARIALIPEGPPRAVAELIACSTSMTGKLARIADRQPRILRHREWVARAPARLTRALGERPPQRLWQRQVLLGVDRPWLWGYTLMLPASRRARLHSLQQIGGRPLGELLFTFDRLQRSGEQTLRLLPRRGLSLNIERVLGELNGPLWGRQTVYHIDVGSLLIVEIFLPDCPLPVLN